MTTTTEFSHDGRVITYKYRGKLSGVDVSDAIRSRYEDPKSATAKVFLHDLFEADFTALTTDELKMLARTAREIREKTGDVRPVGFLVPSKLHFGIVRMSQAYFGEGADEYARWIFLTLEEANQWVTEMLES